MNLLSKFLLQFTVWFWFHGQHFLFQVGNKKRLTIKLNGEWSMSTKLTQFEQISEANQGETQLTTLFNLILNGEVKS